MATKFTSLEEKKVVKKTEFKKVLMDSGICDAEHTPNDWDNVKHLFFDKFFGDVFKCWDDDDEDGFTLFFGEKGDEFNQ